MVGGRFFHCNHPLGSVIVSGKVRTHSDSKARGWKGSKIVETLARVHLIVQNGVNTLSLVYVVRKGFKFGPAVGLHRSLQSAW